MKRGLGVAVLSLLVLCAIVAAAPAEVQITVVPVEGEAAVLSGWIETGSDGRIGLAGERAPFAGRFAADGLVASIVTEGEEALRVEARVWKAFVPVGRLELTGRNLSVRADRLRIAGRAG